MGSAPMVSEGVTVERSAPLAQIAFRISCQALLLGAERVGRLALACEKALDHLAAGSIDAGQALPTLAASSDTLRSAFRGLSQTDRSGAHIEEGPLDRCAPRARSPVANRKACPACSDGHASGSGIGSHAPPPRLGFPAAAGRTGCRRSVIAELVNGIRCASSICQIVWRSGVSSGMRWVWVCPRANST